MKEYECVFNDIHTCFSASVVIFLNSCSQLLQPLNLSDQQTNDLLVQRSPSAWKAPALHKDLEKRLGPNYGTYLSLIGKLNRRILLFCKKLKLNDDLKACPHSSVKEEANHHSHHGLTRMGILTNTREGSFSEMSGLE
jgi:hypothetical protein